MEQYKYAFVDGNWILSRVFFAMTRDIDGRVDHRFKYNLAAVTTNSILKFFRDKYVVGKIILVWDTAPYIKQSLLNNEYKIGRYNPTQELEDETDPEKIRKLEDDAFNLSKKSEAKAIMKELHQVGLPSIWHKGYEADDIVYYLAQGLSPEMVRTGQRSMLVSIDSDWQYWGAPNVDVYNPISEVMYEHEKVREENRVPKEMSLFHFKSLYDSFYGSHNDLVITVTDDVYDDDCLITFDKFKKIGYSPEIFKDVNLARAQMETFNFERIKGYNKQVELDLHSLPLIGSIANESQIASIGMKLKVPLNTGRFSYYLSTLDKNLFKDE